MGNYCKKICITSRGVWVGQKYKPSVTSLLYNMVWSTHSDRLWHHFQKGIHLSTQKNGRCTSTTLHLDNHGMSWDTDDDNQQNSNYITHPASSTTGSWSKLPFFIMSTASWHVTVGKTESGGSKLRDETFSLLHLQIKSLKITSELWTCKKKCITHITHNMLIIHWFQLMITVFYDEYLFIGL